jgi:hypothetical protein
VAVDALSHAVQRLPPLYRAALSSLERAMRAGDEGARLLIEQGREAPIVSVVTLEGVGGGLLSLAADGFALVVRTGAPVEQCPFYALALPAAAIQHAIEELERPVAAGVAQGGAPAGRFLAALASRRARELFGATSYAFDLHVGQVPALGRLRARVALGREDHPPAPEFSLGLDYHELKDARDAGMAPHQLFLSGKIKVEGDAAKAMMLGMTLAQLR